MLLTNIGYYFPKGKRVAGTLGGTKRVMGALSLSLVLLLLWGCAAYFG